MATTPTTLQQIITLLRQRTDMVNSLFVSDAELTTYLNNSLCLLDGILIQQYNDYKLTSAPATVVSGQDYLSLPADFLKLRGVDVKLTTSDGYYSIPEFSFQHRNKLSGSNSLSSLGPYAIEYRLQGSQIKLLPKQLAAQYSYQIWYVPDYIPLINPTDTLQSYMDSQAWYEYAIIDSAIKVLEKQDLDPAVFIQQRQDLKDHIQKLSAPSRNAGSPASVVDSRQFSSYPYGWDF